MKIDRSAVLTRLTHIIDQRSSNRVLTRVRVLLRGNEFYLIPLALVVGVLAGAIVTLMSDVAQIMHVMIFGIPIDVRLSANATVKPWVALTAPAIGASNSHFGFSVDFWGDCRRVGHCGGGAAAVREGAAAAL